MGKNIDAIRPQGLNQLLAYTLGASAISALPGTQEAVCSMQHLSSGQVLLIHSRFINALNVQVTVRSKVLIFI